MSLSRFEVEPVTNTLGDGGGDEAVAHETTSLVESVHDEVNDAGIVMKEPSITDSPQIAGRFHVEFVEPASNGPPTSPTSPGATSETVNSGDTYSNTYYLKTFGYNTHEAIPKVKYYQNSQSLGGNRTARPTIAELHEAYDDVETTVASDTITGVDTQGPAPIRFGWIQGVLIRCVLNIWGVMLFLRLSWIVGQAGIGFTLLIILLSALVTTITTLSMSAICTNGTVRGGGAYYLISRSLGPEFGGAIGLIFSLANAVAVAMYVVGFSETVVELMYSYDVQITGQFTNDTRIIGAITVTLLLGITQLGMAWESKMQMGLLVILLLAILNFLIGCFLPKGQSDQANGVFGFQSEVISENFGSAFRNNQNFFSMFAIFFPAATGILAGCNISGDLKDAQKAIPKGTLLAILITTVVYMLIAIILGSVQVRFASGSEDDFLGVANCTYAACSFGWDYTVPTNLTQTCEESADAPVKCYELGLLNDYQAMQKISWFGPIIIAGIFAATLSSALASLVSAPKIFQAVCKDRLFPAIGFFGKGAAKTDEPQRGYILAFFISMAFILIGELNAIAPIISNFFLASYTLINYSCFNASLAGSPGWRPAFKFYNMWLSLLGALICLGIMFVIQWWAGLVTIVIVLSLYKYVDYKKPDVNWGSSTQAYTYTQSLNYTLKLNSVGEHVKNFRPQLLVLTGCPSHRPALVHLASHITKNVSLMVCGDVRVGLNKFPFKECKEQQAWLQKQHFKSFHTVMRSSSIVEGVNSMVQLSGLGKMRTNTVLMGFKSDWRDVSGQEMIDYTDIIHHAFSMNYGVCILRMKEGLDISQYLEESLEGKSKKSKTATTPDDLTEDNAQTQSNHSGSGDVAVSKGSSAQVRNSISGEGINAAKLKASIQFQAVQDKNKTIDVWWLFDDGGLTILIPYLLSNRPQWAGCKLRIFIGGKKSRIDEDKRAMAQLLSKFRISFEDIIVLGDLNMKPSKGASQEFHDMIAPYKIKAEYDSDECKQEKMNEPWKITGEELDLLNNKTNRHIKLQELLQTHSKDAALILMTLPIARIGCSAALYMAWMEELTRNLPPIILLRGNQTTVLTYYS